MALPFFAKASVPTLLQTCIVCKGKQKHPATYSFCGEATGLSAHVCLRGDTRLQASSLPEYAPFSAQTSIIREQAEKTAYSASSLKTNFVSQNASGSGESDYFFFRERCFPQEQPFRPLPRSSKWCPAMVALDQPGFTTLFPK